MKSKSDETKDKNQPVEIMTAEDVAEYLRISPRTVYDWAQRGLIPCGRLGAVWRFKRSAIEKWLDSKLNATSKGEPAAPPELRDVLVPERVLLTDYASKRESLLGLVDVLSRASASTDPEEVAEGIFLREKIISTGLSFGLAVPHLRIGSITNILMALAVNRTAIADYETLDKAPVRIICMILTGLNQHKQYLSVLAALTSKLKQEDIRNAVLEATDPMTVYRMLVG